MDVAAAFKKWFADRGDQTHRINYALDACSCVFDVGAYHGDWAKTMLQRYHCQLYAFEPVQRFYEIACKTLKPYPTAAVFPYGIAGRTEKVAITLQKDGSSVYASGLETEEIQIRSIVDVMDFITLPVIDLIKINNEGGEYDLLEEAIAKRYHRRFRNIQVQFHWMIPDAEARRARIRAALSRTHRLTYDYPFVWENWEVRS